MSEGLTREDSDISAPHLNRDRPAWGVSGVVSTPPATLSDAQIQTMFDMLGARPGDHAEAVVHLRALADGSPRWRAQQAEWPSRKASRRVLQSVAKVAEDQARDPGAKGGQELRQGLVNLDSQSRGALSEALLTGVLDPQKRDDILGSTAPMIDQPVRLAAAAAIAISNLTGKRGRQTDDEMLFTVSRLAEIAGGVTGKPLTHTRYHGDHYDGGALSPTGRFCTAFFEAIGDRQSARGVAAAIEALLKLLKARSQAAEDGA